MSRVVRRYPLQTALWIVIVILIVLFVLTGWTA